ncbi:acyltransferase family protein, partial [Lactobacillus nasalidis]
LLLALVFAWLLPTALDLASAWPQAPKHLADAVASVKRLLGKLDVQMVMGYAGYYLAGYYLSQAHMSKRHLALVQALGLLGAAATIGLTSWLTVRAGHLRLFLYSYNSLFVFLESCALFLSLQTAKPRARSKQVLQELATSVLGIYLLHPLLIYYWSKTPVWQLGLEQAAWLPVLVLLVFASSLAIVWLLRRSRFLSRWLL